MRDEDGRYSPILEGIRHTVEELGYASVNMTHPYAVFRSRAIKGGTVTINYQSLAIRLLSLWRLGRSRASFRQDMERRLYARVLRLMAPSAIFSVQPPAALCMAAKALEIRIVEAMHGTNISQSDQVFCDHMSQSDDRLPDVILSFDTVSQNTVASLCRGRKITALETRDPWLHHLRRLQAAGWSVERPAQTTKSILVTLQWGYDGERDSLSQVIPNGILHPALEAALATSPGDNLRYLIRMHPLQLNAAGYRHHRRYIESLCARYLHLEFQRASSMPLPILLDEVSGHITMSSSSVGEAFVAGVPTLLLCPSLRPGGAHFGLFRELEPSGMVSFGALDPEDILSWVARCPLRGAARRDHGDMQAAHDQERHFYATLIESPDALRLHSGENPGGNR